jgi:membrane protease YdiL (CAAX protease family)
MGTEDAPGAMVRLRGAWPRSTAPYAESKGNPMADEPNANLPAPDPIPAPGSVPPLVTRPELSEVPAPRKPRPGLGEGVLWCVAFWCVLIVAALGTLFAVVGFHAARSGDPWQFVSDQLGGLADAAKPTKPDQPPRPPVPREIGSGLAYGMFAAQVASLAFVLLLVPRGVGPDWKRQLGVRRPVAMHLFLVLLLVPGFIILAEGIYELFVRVTGIAPTQTEAAIRGTFQQVPWYITLLAVAVGPGLVEELFCRGFLGRGLCSRYGIGWGVVLTSLLFALMHGSVSQVVVFTLMGAYLHFVYLASRSIWVPVLLHLLNNGVVTLIVLHPELFAGWTLFKEDAKGLRAVIDLTSLALVVFASVALWTSRAQVLPVAAKVGPAPTAWEPEYPGVSVPPPQVPAKVSYGAISPAAVVLAMGAFLVLAYLIVRHTP